MSLYNILFGVKPATFFVLPMLGEGHHPDEWPRFRDCFIGDDEHPEYADKIIVYTRTGGGNRDDFASGNDWIRSLPGFVTDYNDSFDCTFACWVFDVPVQWQADFVLVMNGDLANVSVEYQQRIRAVYPKLSAKWDELWLSAAARAATGGDDETK